MEKNNKIVVNENKGIKQINALNALKVVAIILVFNSHCDNLYPIKALATGGALGNALFFVISGYLLSIREVSFGRLIVKRVKQLYPPMLVVSVVYAVIFSYYPSTVMEFAKRFIWPTGYWFVSALLLFNVLIYWMDRYKIFDKFVYYSVVLWIIYFIYYGLFIDRSVWSVEEHGLFRLIYYFYVYSFGYCLKTNKIKINIGQSAAFILAMLCFVFSMGWKVMMNKFSILMQTQCVCQITGAIFAIMILMFILKYEEKYLKWPTWFRNVMNFLSTYSLEIYLTQRTAQRISEGIVFPINFCMAVIITLVYSALIKGKFLSKFSKND